MRAPTKAMGEEAYKEAHDNKIMELLVKLPNPRVDEAVNDSTPNGDSE
jgi:hypothetical protein